MADLSRVTKKYSNGEITVVWKPALCIHSKNCFTGLPGVFDPSKRPWIDPKGAASEEIVKQVNQCPSGALSIFYNSGEANDPIEQTPPEITAEAKPNGPLMVYGNITVKKPDGTTENRTNVTAFCRCGGSLNKPYCDGTHNKLEFRG
ncbi:MAG: (4Fe-4S)-binding protein [Ignavibacteria bacterium]|nr:(4Fe-4S)-binding protein [Ignavibacteria bacterium]